MQINDIVTVKQETEPEEGAHFYMTPGVPGVVWGLPETYGYGDRRVCLAIYQSETIETSHGLNKKFFVYVDPSNLVLIAKADATSFIKDMVKPSYVGQVASILQANVKRKSFGPMADQFNTLHHHKTCWDRWGRRWHFNEIANEMFSDANKRGGDFGKACTQAMHAMAMTYKFSDVDPKAKPEPIIRPTKSQYVNVYCDDRAYGGPQEGGWWYDVSACVESTKVSRKAAHQLLKTRQLECDERNEGAPSISSVLSRGFYRAKLENRPGTDYPGYQPTYS